METKDELIVRPPSMRELVYEKILKLLEDGQIELGEHIVEGALTSRLGTSRTPVREALAKIHSEGFIEMDGSGYRVPHIGIRELWNMSEVRSLLEPKAAQQAVEGFSSPQFERMKNALERECSALEAENSADFAAASDEFRTAWLSMIANSILLNAVNNSCTFLRLLRRKTMADLLLRKKIVEMHQGLIGFVGDHDAKGASNWQRKQIWKFHDLMVERLFSDP